MGSWRYGLSLLVIAWLCSVFAAAQRVDPRYTIAFKSYAPNNTDIFIAAFDGSNARQFVPDPALDWIPGRNR